MDRRSAARTPTLHDVPVRLWNAFVRWQSPFSILSSLLSLVLAIVFVSDLVFGHPHIERAAVTSWLVLYVCAAVIPLACGRRFPRWAGIVIVAGIEWWSTYFLLFAGHAHAEINALLELPMIALYLGWFYRSLVGRIMMALSLARYVVLLVIHPGLGHGVVSAGVTVGTALLVAVFCFEGARAVRRQAHLQSITDPLTGAVNRRGLLVQSRRLRASARRRGEPVALAVVDFDDFRTLNERGGHLAGDAALRDTVVAWQGLVGKRGPHARRGGVVARLGGDEFVLVFRRDVAATSALLRDLRAASEYAWSWGVAPLDPGAALTEAIADADTRLYRAKRAVDQTAADADSAPQ
ncbi:GGDEF domain-containing protein [Leucobacter rhizosphaerae]|uniref:GGDEF domain-containing protein n=1 Tax=Leucobacter rhizosphaerae TaxID=2932245 RepID=A0ABY4FYG0_9MICO|nr:GGDEF domain-containing protein [Leucobacter rhizosphaerae]UOQ61327.1 GGDEF domain-containing protein [Leucobacter rhizosphaerae]